MTFRLIKVHLDLLEKAPNLKINWSLNSHQSWKVTPRSSKKRLDLSKWSISISKTFTDHDLKKSLQTPTKPKKPTPHPYGFAIFTFWSPRSNLHFTNIPSQPNTWILLFWCFQKRLAHSYPHLCISPTPLPLLTL